MTQMATVTVDADSLASSIDDPNVVIVDARGIISYRFKHIKNAKPLGIESVISLGDKEIICYCHAGIRASHKYLQFRRAGYDRVKLYDGSIVDWAQRRNQLR